MTATLAALGVLLWAVQAAATLIGILAALYLFVQLTAPREDRVCGRPRRKGRNHP